MGRLTNCQNWQTLIINWFTRLFNSVVLFSQWLARTQSTCKTFSFVNPLSTRSPTASLAPTSILTQAPSSNFFVFFRFFFSCGRSFLFILFFFFLTMVDRNRGSIAYSRPSFLFKEREREREWNENDLCVLLSRKGKASRFWHVSTT